jgi:intracellular septation protein
MAEAGKQKSGWLNLAVDYGPVIVFFAVYKFYSPANRGNSIAEVLAVMSGTVAFMVAAVVALLLSKWKLGKVSPMLWLSTVLIVGFGGLTVLLHDPIWIQVKPTAIYLKILLEAAFEGLSDEGWLKLSRNWGLFFLVLAGLNEALRHWLSFGDWIAAKLWVFLPATFLFTFAQIPMLLRHGLAADEKAEVLENPPHE